MSASPRPHQRPVNVGPRTISPEELRRFPKRRCANCDKPFPKTRKIKRFCSSTCKDEYHRHGSAYGPLKDQLLKLIAKTAKAEAALQFQAYLDSPDFRAHLSRAGFIHRSQLKPPKPGHAPAELRGAIDVLTRLSRESHDDIVELQASVRTIIAVHESHAGTGATPKGA